MKKCKGTGKALGYGCNKELSFTTNVNGIKTYNAKYGLCMESCYKEWLMNTEEGQEVFLKSLATGKKKIQTKQRKEFKNKKESIIDYSKKLQEKVNEIVRLIDVGLPCLARGYHPNQIHAGHIFSRGSNQSIRYNLHNIHRQSAQSNHYQNEDGLLREGLIKEYGKEYYDFILALRQTPSLEYSNQEFKELNKHASAIARQLKKEGRIFPTTEERIFMRNEINKQLGIYELKYCEYAST